MSAQVQHLLAETAGLLAKHDRVVGIMIAGPVVGRLLVGISEDCAGRILKQVLSVFVVENPVIAPKTEAGLSEALVALHASMKLEATPTVVQGTERHSDYVLIQVEPVLTVNATFKTQLWLITKISVAAKLSIG